MSKQKLNGSMVQAAIAFARSLEDHKASGHWYRGNASFKMFRFMVKIMEEFEGAMTGYLRRWGQDRGMTENEILEALRVMSFAQSAQQEAARHAVERYCLERVALVSESGLDAEPLPNEIVHGKDLEWLLSRPDFIDQVVRARNRLRRVDEEVKVEAGKGSGTGSSGTESEDPDSARSASGSEGPSPS